MSLLINAYSTLHNPPEIEFPHGALNHRGRSDPKLGEHLDGFAGYVESKASGMTAILYNVFRHIRRVQHQYSIEIEETAVEDFSNWAVDANAICFLPDGTVADPWFYTLVDPHGGDPDEEAEVPFPDDAVERKAMTENHLLDGFDIHVPDSLPPVYGSDEVELRDGREVLRRMLALLIAAVRAESVATGEPLSAEELQERLPEGYNSLSPAELDFITTDAPDEQTVAQFGWRYEAVQLLQWALGWTDELSPPTDICDAGDLTKAVLDNDLDETLTSCELRPVDELLDELDFHYRAHWAVVEAQQRGDEDMPGGFDRGIIYERHYTLNWLLRFDNNEWDDIQTAT